MKQKVEPGTQQVELCPLVIRKPCSKIALIRSL